MRSTPKMKVLVICPVSSLPRRFPDQSDITALDDEMAGAARQTEDEVAQAQEPRLHRRCLSWGVASSWCGSGGLRLHQPTEDHAQIAVSMILGRETDDDRLHAGGHYRDKGEEDEGGGAVITS